MKTNGKKGSRGKAEAPGWAAPAGGAPGDGVPDEPDEPSQEGVLAFASVRPELDAMPLSGLGRITVSVPRAVTIGLGALPNVEARYDEFRRRLPEYDVARASRLREYAHASLYAHIVAIRRADGETRLRALLAEGAPLRERMLRSAEVHALYGLLDAGRVAAIRSGTGHLDAAHDLVELAMIFRESRRKLSGQTPVTDAEVERADALGLQIFDALGRREVGTDGASAPAKHEEDRLKAFWLFYNTYELSRQAMTFVRWFEGDADLLAPSLFSGRRRRSPADEPGDEPGPVGPADPSESD